MRKRFVILGGGTAGWMTAARLASEKIFLAGHPIEIILIESNSVPTIGVGEGTWPSMRATLQKIGIPEQEFLRECNASFKQGSRFINWKLADGSYYDHPFTLPATSAISGLGHAFSEADAELSFAHWASLQSDIMSAHCAPKQLATPDYAAVMNYGYHLDAGLFAALLKRYAVDKFGVQHVIDHFSQALLDDNGFITALKCKSGKTIAGDFFIDASGTHNALIGGVYPSEFVSLADVSPNDRALAVPVNYLQDAHPIESATLSTAQESGWIWDIGLQHRRGVGYVYSSQFSSEERARECLQAYINKINPAACASAARLLHITPGYRTQPWVKNCVAVGMASGFIEPLEASALVMVELAINWLCENLPINNNLLDSTAKRYNQLFEKRWTRIRDFLQLHYRLSNRRDSDYWLQVSQNIPMSERLTGLLAEWRYRDPSLQDFGDYMELFPPASYQYVLMGMQPKYIDPCISRGSDNSQDIAQQLRRNRQKLPQYLANLPSNRDFLTAIKTPEPVL